MAARIQVIAAAAVLAVAPVTSALAHGGEALTTANAWSHWDLGADIVIPTALMALLYAAGALRRAAATEPVSWWRHAAFFAGLALVFLALQSPIDPVAERLFSVHQIQHLLLRMAGPMLIALSAPQGVMIAGLRPMGRRSLLAPVVATGAIRTVFCTIAHPVVATALFIGSLYFWEIPRYHNLALLNDPLHYLMHVTMLLAGLVFWWRIFDRRPAPQGVRYGVRLMMLWLAILSNIVLGAYTTLKDTVLYGAYDAVGRLFDLAPLVDERIGGVVIWIPSSMMCLVGILIVVHMWGRHETKLDERRARWSSSNSAALQPISASALIAQQRLKNRTLALGFATFAFVVFATAILVGIVSNLSGKADAGIEASQGQVRHAWHDEGSSKFR